MNWCDQLREQGPASFYQERRRRGATVLTDQKLAECSALLSQRLSIAEVGRRTKVEASTISKALGDGRLTKLSVSGVDVGSPDV